MSPPRDNTKHMSSIQEFFQTLQHCCDDNAERRASGAANGRSEVRAEAIGGRLQANVRLALPQASV